MIPLRKPAPLPWLSKSKTITKAFLGSRLRRPAAGRGYPPHGLDAAGGCCPLLALRENQKGKPEAGSSSLGGVPCLVFFFVGETGNIKAILGVSDSSSKGRHFNWCLKTSLRPSPCLTRKIWAYHAYALRIPSPIDQPCE